MAMVSHGIEEVKRVRTLGVDSIPHSEKTDGTNLTWTQLIDKHKIILSMKGLIVHLCTTMPMSPLALHLPPSLVD